MGFARKMPENMEGLQVVGKKFYKADEGAVLFSVDIQTTMDIYAECTQEKKDEVFANLNGKIMIK